MSRPGSEVRPPAGSGDRPTLLLIALGVVVVGALGAAALVFFGGDDGDDGGGTTAPPSKESASVHVEFQPTQVVSHNGGPPIELPAEQLTAIMQTAGQYLDLAVIEPLKTGKPAGDVSNLFDAATSAQLNGLARPALFEEGLPAATGGIDATARAVTVNGLSDGTAAFVLATVTSDVDIEAETDDGTIRIHRITDLTMMPEGTTWKIVGFDVIVDRKGPGVKTPTAAASSTSTP